MKITVEFLSFPNITRILGSRVLTLNFSGQTIDDLIHEITDRYGEEVHRFLLDESSKLDRVFKILLNKKDWISRDQMDRTLEDGDQVTIMMLVGGG